MSDQTTPAIKPRRRWLRRALVGALLLITALVIALVAAVHSSSATRYVLHNVAKRVDALTLGAVDGTLGEGLTVNDLRFTNPSLDVQIERLGLSASLGALLRGNVLVRQMDVHGLSATSKPGAPGKAPAPLTVPELIAPLPIVVENLRVTDAVWTPLPQTPLQSLKARLAWNGTLISVENLTFATPDVQGDGAASIDTRGDVATSANLNWTYPAQDLDGALSVRGSLASLEVEHQLGGQYVAHSDGTINLLNRLEPYIEMQHTCPPPCVVNDIEIRDSLLAHSGTPVDSAIRLEAQVRIAPIGTSRVLGDLQLEGRELTIESLSISGDTLAASLRGSIDPGGDVLFSINGNLARLDTRMLNEAVEGSISADFALSGSSHKSLRADLENIAGTINGYALAGRANVQRDDARIKLDNLLLALGDNTLRVNGSAARDALKLKANIELPKLEQIDPRLSGSASARAVIGGNMDSPQVQASGQATELSFGELTLALAEFRLNTDKARNVSGSLSARNLQQAQSALGDVDLELDGTLDQLDISAEVDNPQLEAQLVSTLTMAEGTSVLRVNSATIDGKALGIWSLEEAFAIRLGEGVISVAPHLWQSDEAFARITLLEKKQDELTVRAELADLPLELASGFLPPDVSIGGSLDAQLDVAQRNGIWRGNVSWEQVDTVLKLRAGEGSRRLALPIVSVQVQQAPDSATANLTVEGDFGLKIAANLDISNPATLTESPINGTLRANMSDLSWLTPWLPDVSELTGALSAQLDIDGSMAAPALKGSVTFRDGAVAYDPMGLQLEDMAFVARSDQRALVTLEGSANSGGGSLRFDGRIDRPWTAERTVALDITGTDVQAYNAPEYQVWVSPDLTLRVSAEGVRISGDVRVPRANIVVRELPPDVVRRSDDFVVTGRQEKAGFALPFNGDLQVTLGDQVHVYALGLDADVGGNLRVRLSADQAPRLDGRIFLKNGRYEAYGQDLDIERGNIIYAGPIANPTLDIRAARQIDDGGTQISAGVMVSGPATSPEISIFTEPPVSQTDALSYLLLGRAAGDTSGAEGDALSNAALSIGMSRSSSVTDRIASGLGLDEFSVGGDDVDTAELVAGKQLNDRLYIKYSYGVFSNLGAILLRYRLSRRLALEAGSSEVQSIDVLYTIEK